MILKDNWTEQGRTLSATVRGTVWDETVEITVSYALLIPDKIHHPIHKTEGANISMLSQRDGKYIASLYVAIPYQGKKINAVTITEHQYNSALAWVAEAEVSIRTYLQEQINANPTVQVRWGQFNNQREKLISKYLRERGIEWTTDASLVNPHRAEVPRALWNDIENCIALRLAAIDMASATSPAPAQLKVQLWEPCERCGAEPSYQTSRGHLCNRCQ